MVFKMGNVAFWLYLFPPQAYVMASTMYLLGTFEGTEGVTFPIPARFARLNWKLKGKNEMY